MSYFVGRLAVSIQFVLTSGRQKGRDHSSEHPAFQEIEWDKWEAVTTYIIKYYVMALVFIT